MASHPQRALQLGEADVADGFHQPPFHGKAAHEALPGRKGRINQTPERPARFHFPRDGLELRPVLSGIPNRADVGAHARTRHHVHVNPVFLQHLDDADVRQAFGRAGRKRESDETVADFPRQPPEVRHEMNQRAGRRYPAISDSRG